MKKLHLIKETISKLENLDHIKAGARDDAHNSGPTNTPPFTTATTYTLNQNCTGSGRPSEGRKTRG
jgi:hypothetical protein